MTFTVRVDFLTRPALTDPSQRDRVEWPPHPHRLFAAMTAAHYEAGIGRRETLEWLERQGSPEIAAPELDQRTSGTFYVPVNDPDTAKSVAASSLPLGDRRVRQPRTFPVGSLLPAVGGGSFGQHSVYYTWRCAETPPEDLDDILREVTRLGHSSSLIIASVWRSEPPAPSYVPSAEGAIQLRVPEEGTLARLDELHEIRNLPTARQDRRRLSAGPDTWAGYRRARTAEPAPSPWTARWAWTLEPRISVTVWIHLAEAIRGTILAALPATAPEVLTGHARGNHLAVVPLPHVGHPHADASVLGFAVLAPELGPEARDCLLLALAELTDIGRRGDIRAGAAGRFRADVVSARELRRTLEVEDWTGPAHRWATVTPLVYDRYPKRNLAPERIVAESVLRLGLPSPVEVTVGRVGSLAGTPDSGEFRARRPSTPNGRRPDRRPWTHAVLRWDRPVQGPIVVGAMRHFGLGLCKPISSGAPSGHSQSGRRSPDDGA